MNLSVVPYWLEPFFGDVYSQDKLEVLTVAHFGPKLTQPEAELMRLKWFDYRRMHPLKATYYFAHCYSKAYGEFLALAVDRNMRYARGIKEVDFIESREAKSIWKLRQAIDRSGMSYPFFLRFAMNWCFKSLWKRPPRPSQLLHNEELWADAIQAYQESLASSMRFAQDPWYRASMFENHSFQIDYQEFIIAQIKSRKHPYLALNAALYLEDALRFEAAVSEFTETEIKRAIEFA